MSEIVHQYIVVGSGPSGAHAAQTLIEAGAQVTMLDVGFEANNKYELDKATDFLSFRSARQDQYRYFLGENFEGISLDDLKTGAQLTPARKYMIKDIEKLIPLDSNNFTPMESLGYGGLGAGWGLGCYVYTKEELIKIGLNPDRITEGYHKVAERIGISGPNDDFKQHVLGDIMPIQKPLSMDNSLNLMYELYLKKKKKFNLKNIYFGSPSMALLSEDKGSREKTGYEDMDFYADFRMSAYRPSITVNELRGNSNFRYINNSLVTKFVSDEDYVNITVINLTNNLPEIYRCKKLILASGALGTARIVLRSFSKELKQLPILSNPYIYMPCINVKMLGKPLDRFKTSMAQAMMIYDKEGDRKDVVSLAFYTYRSLMLFRLLTEVPLGIKDGVKFLQYLQSAFVIAGIHFPDSPTPLKHLNLIDKPGSITGDCLHVDYSLNGEEELIISQKEATIKKYLRKLNCYPIKKINPGNGSSIHYAGTVPFNNDRSKIGTMQPSGELNGAKNVFIADSSGFTFLPSKGITFTLMANAHIVAENSLRA